MVKILINDYNDFIDKIYIGVNKKGYYWYSR